MHEAAHCIADQVLPATLVVRGTDRSLIASVVTEIDAAMVALGGETKVN